MISRRAFLAASAALGAGTGSEQEPTPPRPRSDPGDSFDPWVEVNPQNLRHNVGEIARVVGGRPILAVIKNNGYGLGVANVARLLDDDPRVAGFAVVKLQEAMTLRDAGIRRPILLMGPFTDRELADVAARDIMPMVYRDHGGALDGAAARTGRPVRVHVKVDTGMGRVGVHYRQAAELIRSLAARKSCSSRGS